MASLPETVEGFSETPTKNGIILVVAVTREGGQHQGINEFFAGLLKVMIIMMIFGKEIHCSWLYPILYRLQPTPRERDNRFLNWVFAKIGVPPKWMVKIMENPIKMDDLGKTHYFRKI